MQVFFRQYFYNFATMAGRNLYKDFQSGRMELLYSEYYPALISYAVRFLGQNYAWMAEDCVQESIFKAYLVKDRIPDGQALKAYIYTSVRNRAVSILRKDNSQRNYLKNLELSEQDIMASIIEQETMRRLFVAIDALPEHFRQVFDLSFEEGFKNQEIARMLGISESAVKKRKAKMLTLLRKSVSENEEPVILALLTMLASQLR